LSVILVLQLRAVQKPLIILYTRQQREVGLMSVFLAIAIYRLIVAVFYLHRKPPVPRRMLNKPGMYTVGHLACPHVP